MSQFYQPPGGYQPPAQPYGHPQDDRFRTRMYKAPIRRTANILAGGLVLMMVTSYGLSYLLYFIRISTGIGFEEWPSWVDELVDLVYYTLMFLVPILVTWKLLRIPARVAFPLRNPGISLTIPALFVCMGATYLGSILASWVSIIVEGVSGLAPTMPDMDAPRGVAAIAIHFVSIAIAPAILEELLYRGLIMQSLRRFGDGFALVVSSILFALGHGNLVQGPYTLVVGLVIGYFVLRSGSLLIGMAMHFFNNAMAVVSDLMYQYAPWRVYDMFTYILLAVYVLGGIAALIYLMIKQYRMFRVKPSFYPLRTSGKYAAFFLTVFPILYCLIMLWFTSLYLE